MTDPFMVKVQRSIQTSASKPQMMVYDKDKNVMWQSDLDPAVAKAMGNRLRCYWWATLREDGVIELQGKPYHNDNEGETNFNQFTFAAMNPKA